MASCSLTIFWICYAFLLHSVDTSISSTVYPAFLDAGLMENISVANEIQTSREMHLGSTGEACYSSFMFISTLLNMPFSSRHIISMHITISE